MLLRRIADARVFNCEDDRGRLGVKITNFAMPFYGDTVLKINFQLVIESGTSVQASRVRYTFM